MSEQGGSRPADSGGDGLDRFTLDEAVRAANKLLAYAASKGLGLKKELIQKIVASRDLPALDPKDAGAVDRQAAFWGAYDELAAAVRPVTTESISVAASMWRRWGLFVQAREAFFGPLRTVDKAVRAYRRWSTLALALVLLMQAYWGVGSLLKNQAAELENKAQEIFQEQFRQEQEARARLVALASGLTERVEQSVQAIGQPGRAPAAAESKSARDLRKKARELLASMLSGEGIVESDLAERFAQLKSELERDARMVLAANLAYEKVRADIEDVEAELALRNDSLKKWNMVWKIVLNPSRLFAGEAGPEQEDAVSRYKELNKANLDTTLALNVIEINILPLLFGWLGSCLFVLRSLARDVEALSYTSEQNMLYKIRLFTGALAGLVIGGFGLLHDAASPLASLTPFALAFIAGYSVDLFIAAMDKIIAAFTAKEGGQKA